jgi:hypothetical protein
VSGWWLLAAFAAGWMACWWFGKYILALTFKRGGPIMEEALRGLRQESLLKVRDTGNGWKRLRDWTADDLRSRAGYYIKISNTSLKLAEWCNECVDLMEAENVKTLGKVKADLPVLSGDEIEVIENGKEIESVTS